MIILRQLNVLKKCRSDASLYHIGFIIADGGLLMFSLLMLILMASGSSCLASFYLFTSLFYLGQCIAHYLLRKIPKSDAIRFDYIIKRLITIICIIQIFYLLLCILYWQKSLAHPIYCALCHQYDILSYPLIGFIIIVHFIITFLMIVTLIHTFVSRKYFLIALGGFEVQKRLQQEKEQQQRRIGLIQPNYPYPIQYSIQSNKYYHFQDILQIEDELGDSQTWVCSICLNRTQNDRQIYEQNIVKTKCCHKFHRSCIQKWASIHSSCPDCRAQFKQSPRTSLNKPQPEENPQFSRKESSKQLATIVEDQQGQEE